MKPGDFDATTGVWETTLVLGPEEIEADREFLVEILNGLPKGVHVTGASVILPSGRAWTFRMLSTAVLV